MKKWILRKQVQTSVNYPIQNVMQSWSCLNQELSQENSSPAKKDRLERAKSYWKRSKIYHFSLCETHNFYRRLTMLADILKDLELSSKKLRPVNRSIYIITVYICMERELLFDEIPNNTVTEKPRKKSPKNWTSYMETI